jgi:competence protein ComEA
MDKSIGRHRSLLVVCSVLSLVVGGVLGFYTPRPRGQAVVVSTPAPTPTQPPTPTQAPLRVYVSGAVSAPAVYRLPPGSLVEDAIRVGGGPTADADLDRVNLARELLDQQQVYVPRVGEENPPSSLSGGAAVADQLLVNVNTATAAELEALPGIGPTTAQRIVEYRTSHGFFASVEEIMQVPGIGPAVFEEVSDQITVN